MSYEVEFKFAVPDMSAFRQRLATLSPQAGDTATERDTYFAHPSRDFGVTNEAFRLRSVDEENRLTYKGPLIDEISKTRREIELPVGSGRETVAQLTEMLTLLGFRPVRVVAKQREYYHLDWQGYTVDVTLDNVTGLDTFAELECQAEEAAVPAVRESLLQLASRLELRDSIRKSYLCLLLEQDDPTAGT